MCASAHLLLLCVAVAGQPAAWTCAASRYGDGVCDCSCGAADPDCAEVSAGAAPPRFCATPAVSAGSATCAYVAGWGSDVAGALGDASQPYATLKRALNVTSDVAVLPGRLEGAGNCGLERAAAASLRGLPGARSAAVDCAGAGRRFWTHAGAGGLAIAGLTVLNGVPGSPTLEGSLPAAGRNAWGGALAFLSSGALSISSCRFLQGRAVAGAAVLVYGPASVEIADTEFRGNVAAESTSGTAAQGGAVALYSPGSVAIRGCTFASNRAVGNGTARSGLGAAVAVAQGLTAASVAIEDSTFQDNVAEAAGSATPAGLGGAVGWSGGSNPDGSLSVARCRFLRNSALGAAAESTGLGGALWAGGARRLSVADSTFEANLAVGGYSYTTGQGSAATLDSVSVLALSRCTFVGNAVRTGTYGSVTGNDGTLTLVSLGSCTLDSLNFTSNTVPGDCSAISIAIASGLHLLTRLTVQRNTAGGSGTLCAVTAATAAGRVLVEDSLFTDNAAGPYAGAMYSNGCYLSCTRCRVARNSAANGGALSSQSTVPMEFFDSEFDDNTAETSGGVIFLSSGTALFRNCTMRRSRSEQGGAVFLYFGLAVIESSRLEGNLASAVGGAVYLINGELRLADSAFVRNSAMASGGVVHLTNVQTRLTVTRCTFEGNSAGIFNGQGGALVFLSPSLEAPAIVDSTFLGNTAVDKGGAVFVGVTAVVRFVRCRFERNRALAGGAVAVEALAAAEVAGSAFAGNEAAEQGGALFVGSLARLALQGGTLAANAAAAGGGIAVVGTATANVTGAALRGNLATGAGGGGLYIREQAAVLFAGVLFDQNTAAADGGGALVEGARSAALEAPVFARNAAANGAGLAYVSGPLVVRNGSFASNAAAGRGGGIHVAKQGGNASFCATLRLPNATFEGNGAGESGGAGFVASVAGCAQGAEAVCPACAFRSNAAVHGPDFASAPVVLVPSYGSLAAASGEVLPILRLALVDAFGVVSAADNATVVTAAAASVLIGTAVRKVVGGVACFDDLALFGQPNETFSLDFAATVGAATFAASVRLALRPCRRGEVQRPGTVVCTRCPPGTYSLEPPGATRDRVCLPCPPGSSCQGDELASLAGHWGAPWNATAFLPCVNAACRANSSCAPGYEGHLCTRCAPGFGRANRFDCRLCPPSGQNAALSVAAFLLLVLLAALMVRSTMKNALDERSTASILIKIFLNYIQIMTFSQSFDLPWPNSLKDIFNVQDYTTSPLSSIISIDCMLEPSSGSVFFTRVLLYAVLPPIAVGLCGGFWMARQTVSRWWLAVELRRGAPLPPALPPASPRGDPSAFPPLEAAKLGDEGEQPPGGAAPGPPRPARRGWRALLPSRPSPQALSGLWENFVTSVVIAIFLIHPTVSRELVGLFDCKELAGRSFLKQDMNIECKSGVHLAWAVALGLPSVTVVCVGVPLAALLLLVQNRRRLEEPAFRSMFGFLYRGYRRPFFFWESVVIFRKLLIVFVSVYFSGRSMTQALVGLLILLLVVISEALALPFDRPLLNYIDIAAVSTAAFTVYAGLFFYSEEALISTLKPPTPFGGARPRRRSARGTRRSSRSSSSPSTPSSWPASSRSSRGRRPASRRASSPTRASPPPPAPGPGARTSGSRAPPAVPSRPSPRARRASGAWRLSPCTPPLRPHWRRRGRGRRGRSLPRRRRPPGAARRRRAARSSPRRAASPSWRPSSPTSSPRGALSRPPGRPGRPSRRRRPPRPSSGRARGCRSCRGGRRGRGPRGSRPPPRECARPPSVQS